MLFVDAALLPFLQNIESLRCPYSNHRYDCIFKCFIELFKRLKSYKCFRSLLKLCGDKINEIQIFKKSEN